MRARAPMTMIDDRRWGDRCRWAPVVHADGHAGAMNVCMTMVRPGLFLQREGPGSEPGNSLRGTLLTRHPTYSSPTLLVTSLREIVTVSSYGSLKFAGRAT